MSQPLRADQCRSFLQGGNADQVILTRNSSPFADLDLDNSTDLVVLGSPGGPQPIAEIAGSRAAKWLVSFVGADSRSGRWLAMTISRIAWRLRYFDRWVMVRASRRRAKLESSQGSHSPLFIELEAQRHQGPIDQIVVFDLYDLPVVSEFAARHGVEVLVR